MITVIRKDNNKKVNAQLWSGPSDAVPNVVKPFRWDGVCFDCFSPWSEHGEFVNNYNARLVCPGEWIIEFKPGCWIKASQKRFWEYYAKP